MAPNSSRNGLNISSYKQERQSKLFVALLYHNGQNVCGEKIFKQTLVCGTKLSQHVNKTGSRRNWDLTQHYIYHGNNLLPR
jgi:hypothetical protein